MRQRYPPHATVDSQCQVSTVLAEPTPIGVTAMPTTTPPADAPAAALVTAKECAALLAVSSRHWFRLVDAGRAPAPIRLGALVRWRRADLDDWISAGCPSHRRAGR